VKAEVPETGECVASVAAPSWKEKSAIGSAPVSGPGRGQPLGAPATCESRLK
jgi:hypothetical protein